MAKTASLFRSSFARCRPLLSCPALPNPFSAPPQSSPRWRWLRPPLSHRGELRRQPPPPRKPLLPSPRPVSCCPVPPRPRHPEHQPPPLRLHLRALRLLPQQVRVEPLHWKNRPSPPGRNPRHSRSVWKNCAPVPPQPGRPRQIQIPQGSPALRHPRLERHPHRRRQQLRQPLLPTRHRFPTRSRLLRLETRQDRVPLRLQEPPFLPPRHRLPEFPPVHRWAVAPSLWR